MTVPDQLLATRHLGLVEAVDGLLHKGVVINGDAMVSLAEVDLVYLQLSLMLCSVQKLAEEGMLPRPKAGGLPPHSSSHTAMQRQEGHGMYMPLNKAAEQAAASLSPSEHAGALNEARDLGRLVLTLVDLLRRVLERQALRRMEADALSEEETERMGLALMELDSRMTELCEAFGLRRDELDIDLGPLGKINT